MNKPINFMMTACPTCGEYMHHKRECPEYPSTIKFKIWQLQEQIKFYQIELEYWKMGKDITGEKIKLLKSRRLKQ